MLPYSDVGLQFYWQNTIVSAAYFEKNKELVDNVVEGVLEGLKFMLLNPQEAMERHLKEHPELAIGKNGRLYVELGLGMTNAIMISPESMQHGLGDNANKVTLTAAEWEQVRSNSQKYAKLLAKG